MSLPEKCNRIFQVNSFYCFFRANNPGVYMDKGIGNGLGYIFLAAFFLNFFITGFIKWFCLRGNIFKVGKSVTYLGGLGVFVSLFLVFLGANRYYNLSLPAQLSSLLIFSGLMFGLGLIDDLIELTMPIKLFSQIVLIGGFLIFGKHTQIYFLPVWLNYFISFLWIAGITNAFNLIDISDGFCCGVSLICSLFFAVIALLIGNSALLVLFTVLCAILLAFMLFNLHSAKIILGNSGSHFLGFLFAGLSIYGDYSGLNNKIAFILPLLVLAFPIIDTGFLVIARAKKNILPLRKSADHIFLRLTARRLSSKKVLLNIYLVCFLWGLSAILSIPGFNFVFFITVVTAIFFTVKIIQRACLPNK
jgi:UDP-GlcNAc:undecaprenyl-phosphate GlcNAc-1-phosphate transferase